MSIPETELGDFLYCLSLLENGVRASETDCVALDSNLAYNTTIGIADLNLAPMSLEKNYVTPGSHALEIIVTLIKNDSSIAAKISGDGSADLNVLLQNSVAIGRTGEFTLVVTE